MTKYEESAVTQRQRENNFFRSEKKLFGPQLFIGGHSEQRLMSGSTDS